MRTLKIDPSVTLEDPPSFPSSRSTIVKRIVKPIDLIIFS